MERVGDMRPSLQRHIEMKTHSHATHMWAYARNCDLFKERHSNLMKRKSSLDTFCASIGAILKANLPKKI